MYGIANDTVNYQNTLHFYINIPGCLLQGYISEIFQQTFCLHIAALMRSVEGVSKFNREEWQVQLTPVLNLWKKLNQVCSVYIYHIVAVFSLIL